MELTNRPAIRVPLFNFPKRSRERNNTFIVNFFRNKFILGNFFNAIKNANLGEEQHFALYVRYSTVA